MKKLFVLSQIGVMILLVWQSVACHASSHTCFAKASDALLAIKQQGADKPVPAVERAANSSRDQTVKSFNPTYSQSAQVVKPELSATEQHFTFDNQNQIVAQQVITLPNVSGSAQSTLNINEADAQALAAGLKGIGIAKAQAIVAYRQTHGAFKSADELGQIKGIGPATIAKNLDVIRVN